MDFFFIVWWFYQHTAKIYMQTPYKSEICIWWPL